MNRETILNRTGGVIKFRKPVLEVCKQNKRRGHCLGVASRAILQNQRCGFCGEARTDEQICTTRGRRGRKTVDIAWTWICSACKAKIEGGGQ
jgi:hypothetical protein